MNTDPFRTGKYHPIIALFNTMMMPSNGIIFNVTGPLWGESPVTSGFPSQRASNMELWCFLWSAPRQIDEKQTGKGANYEHKIYFAYYRQDDINVLRSPPFYLYIERWYSKTHYKQAERYYWSTSPNSMIYSIAEIQTASPVSSYNEMQSQKYKGYNFPL